MIELILATIDLAQSVLLGLITPLFVCAACYHLIRFLRRH